MIVKTNCSVTLKRMNSKGNQVITSVVSCVGLPKTICLPGNFDKDVVIALETVCRIKKHT
jgi:hypothetical protein